MDIEIKAKANQAGAATTQEIQRLAGKMQVLKYHSPVIENFAPFLKWEYDVLSVSKSQMLCEFEVVDAE